MMKNLCSTLLLLCCCSLQPVAASASTWVDLYSIDNMGSVAIDADSFTYDGEKGMVHLWQRIVSAGDNSVLELEYSYNLAEETQALLGECFYLPGEKPSRQSYKQISYQPVSQDTYEEKTLLFLQLIDYLEQNNVPWEFNQQNIPEPSDLLSPAWKLQPPALVYDSATDFQDQWAESYWSRDEEHLDYMRVSNGDLRVAVLAQRFMQDGEPYLQLKYPLVIWSEPQGDITEAQQRGLMAQAVLLEGIYSSYANTVEGL